MSESWKSEFKRAAMGKIVHRFVKTSLKLLTILIDFLIFVPFFKQSIANKRTSNGERFFPSSVLYLSLFFELRILN